MQSLDALSPIKTNKTGNPRVVFINSDQSLQRFLASDQMLPAAESVTWEELLALCPDADPGSFQLAAGSEIPLVDIAALNPEPAALSLLNAPDVRRLRAIPLSAHQGRVAVAMERPNDENIIAAVNFLLNERVMPLVVAPRGVREAIARYYDRREDVIVSRQLGLNPDVRYQNGETDFEKLAREKPIVRIVSDLLLEAVARRASDIHLRPGPHGLEVLFRIDDEMVSVRRFIHALHAAIVSRIKVLANMNLAEHRRPQDGRSTLTLEDNRKVDMRISVLPAVHGESVVVRLLDTKEGMCDLDKLGLTEQDRLRVNEIMGRSHGMFLTTGPTGCGKSTTLFAMLLELRKQRINILTIEDPVEFYIEDIQQMQVNRAVDFTFASAMKNFLRHDPDVIMVGEIRDRETAGIAVESALTGHLLLSTLHTNTAATTVTRLLDLGIESYLLRASLLAVMSQRLVRLICRHCRMPDAGEDYVRQALGVGESEVFYSGKGCFQCEGLGMHQRQAVYELMVITPRLQSLIVPNAQADEIHRIAVIEGMVPITQAALSLARAGLISLAEAWRVRSE